MLKILTPALMGLMSASVALNSSAALPPKYLGVQDFKQCLGIQQIRTFSVWCLPAEKPEGCPATSWEELKALTGPDKIPDCPSGSDTATPPFAG